jgi:hypothetical protein
LGWSASQTVSGTRRELQVVIGVYMVTVSTGWNLARPGWSYGAHPELGVSLPPG